MKERCSPHGWTTDTLEEHLSDKIASVKESVTLALNSSEKALTKAETALERRLDLMNEFRDTIQDQSSKFLPRTEYTVQHKALMDRADSNIARIAHLEALALGRKEGLGLVGSIILGSAAALSTLISLGILLTSILHNYVGHP